MRRIENIQQDFRWNDSMEKIGSIIWSTGRLCVNVLIMVDWEFVPLRKYIKLC